MDAGVGVGSGSTVVSATADQLVQAVIAMYAGNVQAKDWLLSLMNSPLSWSLPTQVLQMPTAPSTEVCFYCANMLSTRVRKSWGTLAAPVQQQTITFLWNCLKRQPPFPKLVHERITITLARAVLQSPALGGGKPPIVPFLSECLTLVQSSEKHTMTVLAIFLSLATELGTVPITARQRQDIEAEMTKFCVHIDKVITHAVNSAAAANDGTVLAAAFVTAQNWVRIGLNLCFLTLKAPTLLQAALKILASGATPGSVSVGGSNNGAVCVAVADFLERALEAESSLSLYGPDVPSDRVPHIIAGIITGVNQTKNRYALAVKSPNVESEVAVARALTRLTSITVEAFASFVTKGSHPSCLVLAQYMLGQTENPRRDVGALTMDGWTCVQDIPMAERCPQMKEPLLTRLLDVVMKQCTLSVDAGSQNPLSSVSEADDEDDDDAIGAFRVGPPGCTDLLGSLVNTIPQYFSKKIAHTFATGAIDAAVAENSKSSWVNREAALFVFYKVASECPPAIAQTSLIHILEVIRKQPALAQAAPRLTATTCRVIAAYAGQVLCKPPNSAALFFAMQFFEHVVKTATGTIVPVVAARALSRTCTAARQLLGTRTQIAKLASSSDDAADRGINAEARIELAKAVGVLITSFGAQRLNKDPQTSKNIAELIANCAAKNCARLRHFMTEAEKLKNDQTSPRRLQFMKGVACELECLRSLLRWLQFPTASLERVTHPLQHVLTSLWPVLEALPAHFLRARAVMRELCELYTVIFLALRTNTIRILPKLLTNANDIYCAHGLSQCLRTIRMAFEQFGSTPSVHQLFHDLMKRICEVTFSWVTAKSSKFTEDPELVETFFEFVRNAIVFCPAALLLNPVLSNVFKLATMVADTDDAKMCRESLRFLALLLDKTGLAKRQRGSAEASGLAAKAHPRVTECVKLHGQHLVQVLLKGIAGRANELAWRWLANTLWFLATEYPAAVNQWLKEGLGSSIFAAIPGFTMEAKVHALDAMQKYSADNKTKTQRLMRMLIRDMCLFCRRETDIGDILAHPVAFADSK